MKSEGGKMKAKLSNSFGTYYPSLPFSVVSFLSLQPSHHAPRAVWWPIVRLRPSLGISPNLPGDDRLAIRCHSRSGNDILTTHDLGVAHQAISDGLRMFDEVAVMAHDSRNQYLSVR